MTAEEVQTLNERATMVNSNVWCRYGNFNIFRGSEDDH